MKNILLHYCLAVALVFAGMGEAEEAQDLSSLDIWKDSESAANKLTLEQLDDDGQPTGVNGLAAGKYKYRVKMPVGAPKIVVKANWSTALPRPPGCKENDWDADTGACSTELSRAASANEGRPVVLQNGCDKDNRPMGEGPDCSWHGSAYESVSARWTSASADTEFAWVDDSEIWADVRLNSNVAKSLVCDGYNKCKRVIIQLAFEFTYSTHDLAGVCPDCDLFRGGPKAGLLNKPTVLVNEHIITTGIKSYVVEIDWIPPATIEHPTIKKAMRVSPKSAIVELNPSTDHGSISTYPIQYAAMGAGTYTWIQLDAIPRGLDYNDGTGNIVPKPRGCIDENGKFHEPNGDTPYCPEGHAGGNRLKHGIKDLNPGTSYKVRVWARHKDPPYAVSDTVEATISGTVQGNTSRIVDSLDGSGGNTQVITRDDDPPPEQREEDQTSLDGNEGELEPLPPPPQDNNPPPPPAQLPQEPEDEQPPPVQNQPDPEPDPEPVQQPDPQPQPPPAETLPQPEPEVEEPEQQPVQQPDPQPQPPPAVLPQPDPEPEVQPEPEQDPPPSLPETKPANPPEYNPGPEYVPPRPPSNKPKPSNAIIVHSIQWDNEDGYEGVWSVFIGPLTFYVDGDDIEVYGRPDVLDREGEQNARISYTDGRFIMHAESVSPDSVVRIFKGEIWRSRYHQYHLIDDMGERYIINRRYNSGGEYTPPFEQVWYRDFADFHNRNDPRPQDGLTWIRKSTSRAHYLPINFSRAALDTLRQMPQDDRPFLESVVFSEEVLSAGKKATGVHRASWGQIKSLLREDW